MKYLVVYLAHDIQHVLPAIVIVRYSIMPFLVGTLANAELMPRRPPGLQRFLSVMSCFKGEFS